MTRTTFSYGETPREVIAERLPHKYEMSLNRADMLALLAALNIGPGTREGDLRSAILDTLGIEEV